MEGTVEIARRAACGWEYLIVDAVAGDAYPERCILRHESGNKIWVKEDDLRPAHRKPAEKLRKQREVSDTVHAQAAQAAQDAEFGPADDAPPPRAPASQGGSGPAARGARGGGGKGRGQGRGQGRGRGRADGKGGDTAAPKPAAPAASTLDQRLQDLGRFVTSKGVALPTGWPSGWKAETRVRRGPTGQETQYNAFMYGQRAFSSSYEVLDFVSGGGGAKVGHAGGNGGGSSGGRGGRGGGGAVGGGRGGSAAGAKRPTEEAPRPAPRLRCCRPHLQAA